MAQTRSRTFGYAACLRQCRGGLAKQDNRDLACPRTKRPAGRSCQEYPYACTEEGGANAITGEVSIAEQRLEGATLSILVTAFGMKKGDKIFVIPVSKKYTPEKKLEEVKEKKLKIDNWYEFLPGIIEKLFRRMLPPIIIPEGFDPGRTTSGGGFNQIPI